MQKLIEYFMHAPANNHQDMFLEAEADLVSGDSRPEFGVIRMRTILLEWCSSKLDHRGISVTEIGNQIFISVPAFSLECSYDFNTGSKRLLELLELANKDDIAGIFELLKKMKEE